MTMHVLTPPGWRARDATALTSPHRTTLTLFDLVTEAKMKMWATFTLVKGPQQHELTLQFDSKLPEFFRKDIHKF